jgi:hypothetical protein
MHVILNTHIYIYIYTIIIIIILIDSWLGEHAPNKKGIIAMQREGRTAIRIDGPKIRVAMGGIPTISVDIDRIGIASPAEARIYLFV